MNQLVSSLCSPGAYSHATATIKVIETHASWVLLTGDFAYKIKKPIKFPFLDFSTLERRKHFCEEEVRLNQRLAPELYVGVIPIGGSATNPIVGAAPAIEYAVKMIQFSADGTLDNCIGRLSDTAAKFRDLAERVAIFHTTLPAVDDIAPEATALQNANELFDLFDDDAATGLRKLSTWVEDQTRAAADIFVVRRREGAIKEGHGDLHLANLAYFDDRIIPFDCLEFDRGLRCIDTIDEIAFLTMDCIAHGRDDVGYECLNRYLEVSGDYAGVRLLRFYLVHRALVRCKARKIESGQRSDPDTARIARHYFDLAEQLSKPAAPILAITHGFSGCGKTTITNELIGALPAIRVRSDLERKRLAGLRPEQTSGSALSEGIYTEAISSATYEALEQAVAAALDARLSIIVDATFLARDRRASFARLACEHDARFIILDFCTDESVLRGRVEQRSLSGKDASEANLAVLERQLRTADKLSNEEQRLSVTVDTNETVDVATLAERVTALGKQNYRDPL